MLNTFLLQFLNEHPYKPRLKAGLENLRLQVLPVPALKRGEEIAIAISSI